jgi:hypothetical protein
LQLAGYPGLVLIWKHVCGMFVATRLCEACRP